MGGGGTSVKFSNFTGRLDVTSNDMQTCLAVRRLSCFSCWQASHVNPRALPTLPELHCACHCVCKCVVLRSGLCTPPSRPAKQNTTPQPIPRGHLPSCKGASAVASAELHRTAHCWPIPCQLSDTHACTCILPYSAHSSGGMPMVRPC